MADGALFAAFISIFAVLLLAAWRRHAAIEVSRWESLEEQFACGDVLPGVGDGPAALHCSSPRGDATLLVGLSLVPAGIRIWPEGAQGDRCQALLFPWPALRFCSGESGGRGRRDQLLFDSGGAVWRLDIPPCLQADVAATVERLSLRFAGRDETLVRSDEEEPDRLLRAHGSGIGPQATLVQPASSISAPPPAKERANQ